MICPKIRPGNVKKKNNPFSKEIRQRQYVTAHFYNLKLFCFSLPWVGGGHYLFNLLSRLNTNASIYIYIYTYIYIWQCEFCFLIIK